MNVPENPFTKYLAFFQTYQPVTWLCILLALIVQCVLSLLEELVWCRMKKVSSKVTVRLTSSGHVQAKAGRLAERVWEVLQLQVMQAVRPRHKLVSGEPNLLIF